MRRFKLFPNNREMWIESCANDIIHYANDVVNDATAQSFHRWTNLRNSRDVCMCIADGWLANYNLKVTIKSVFNFHTKTRELTRILCSAWSVEK